MMVTRLACASHAATSPGVKFCAMVNSGKKRKKKSCFIPVKRMKIKKETPQLRGENNSSCGFIS
jgi:hypothetical protein